MADTLVERAIRAIKEIHSDTTVTPAQTLLRLQEVAEEIDAYIGVLKDEVQNT